MSDKLAAFRELANLPDLDPDEPIRGNGLLPAWHLFVTPLETLSPEDFLQLVLLYQEYGPDVFAWQLQRSEWSVEYGPLKGGHFVQDELHATKRAAMQRIDQVMRSEIENRRGQ